MSAMIEQAKNNAEAYETLYIRLYTPIYRYLYFRLRDQEIAEDLTHDVFVQIYTAQVIFDSEEHERRFFFTSARNRLIDYLRKKKDLPLDEGVAESIPDSVQSDDGAQRREDTNLITKLLSTLPEDQYTVLVLRYIDDKTTREIADSMDKSEEAVRQIQSRALKTLREQTQHYE